MKLVNGQWTAVVDQAINEITTSSGDPAPSGPESVYWLGSAKFTNEAAYLNRKLAAFWEPQFRPQARICHSTPSPRRPTWGLRRV